MSDQANKKKPGLFRRFFSMLDAVGRFLRSALNILFLLIFLVVIASLFSGKVKPLPDRAFLRVAPSGMLVEQLAYRDPLTQLAQQSASRAPETLLADLIEAIDKAGGDPRITGLVLELDYLAGGGISKLSELGAALTRFKESGKTIIATGSSYSQQQYYLASFANEVHLNPMGTVLVTGYGAYGQYFKEAFDKLGINFHIFRVGEFKDAVEPFIRNNMSEASKKQTRSWIDELWQTYTSQVEKNRDMPDNTIDKYISEVGHNLKLADGNVAELARKHSLVDHINTKPAMLRHLQSLAGKNPDDENDYLNIDYRQYLFHQRQQVTPTDDSGKIGLIVAKGTIYDGKQPEGNIGGATLSKLLQRARKDNKLDALVIRVDSPGGSAFASDIIRQEIKLIQQSGTPVVVSMGSVAASGGYWIAASADQIWASPTTITGSIGVFGVVPTFEKTLAAIGIHNDGIGTAPLADIYRLDRPMTEQAGQLIQLNVENIYRQFLQLVASGRDLPLEQVQRIAEGRVWTGTQAKQLGLVDELGSLQDAVKAAAKLAGLKDYDIKPIERELLLPEQVLKQLAQRVNLTRLGLPFIQHSNTALQAAVFDRVQDFAEKAGLLASPNDPVGLYLECMECRAF